MFFDDPVAAFTRLRHAVTADAHLVFSCFRDVTLNPWAIETGAAVAGTPPQKPGTSPGPFAFADADHVSSSDPAELAPTRHHGRGDPASGNLWLHFHQPPNAGQ